MIMGHHMQGLSRRDLVAALAGLTTIAIAGCSRSPTSKASESSVNAVARPASMTVYRDPSCGCCEAWAEIARQAGYQVSVVDRSDMPAIKTRLGVPEALASCHTTTVGGYALEGHVPLEDVARLMERQPKGIRGLAVAGMPRGSPGMEMRDGAKDAFQVMAFDAAGNTSVFRT